MTTPDSIKQAFPCAAFEPDSTGSMLWEGGMTLRQWYAGLAMQALISLPNSCLTENSLAESALLYADALIAKGK